MAVPEFLYFFIYIGNLRQIAVKPFLEKQFFTESQIIAKTAIQLPWQAPQQAWLLPQAKKVKIQGAVPIIDSFVKVIDILKLNHHENFAIITERAQ